MRLRNDLPGRSSRATPPTAGWRPSPPTWSASAVQPQRHRADRSDRQRHHRPARRRRQRQRRVMPRPRFPGLARPELDRCQPRPRAGRKLAIAAPAERDRTIFRLQPTIREGIGIVKIKGDTEPFGTDAVKYRFRIVPEGFPDDRTGQRRAGRIGPARSHAARRLGQGHAQVPAAGLPVDAGRPAEGPRRPAPRAARLLRADLDQQLSRTC